MAASKDPPLAARRCVPCEGGTPSLTDDAAAKMLGQVTGWEIRTGGAANAAAPGDAHPEIHKKFQFVDFLAAMAFVDRLAALAEEEGHHPDFCVHYSQVDVTLWTHAVRGLSENDFILAAKIDAIVG